jgi:hypothetical protein
MVMEDYIAVGVPRTDSAWKMELYQRALDVLISLDRRRLPRLGSEKSGALFDALLGAQRKNAEQALEVSLSADEFIGNLRNMYPLYAFRERDGLLFARELTSILDQSLVMRRAVLEESRSHLASLHGHLSMHQGELTSDARRALEGQAATFVRLIEIGTEAVCADLDQLYRLREFACLDEPTREVISGILRQHSSGLEAVSITCPSRK